MMRINYKFEPVLLTELLYVIHKGKKRGFQGRENSHDKFHEIIYVDYGRINISIDGKESCVQPGECIIVPRGAAHFFSGDAGAPFDFLNILFAGTLPDFIFGRSIALNKTCLDFMQRLRNESVNDEKNCEIAMASLLTSFLIYLMRQLECSVPNRLPEIKKRYSSDVVNRALSIIEKEYSKPLSLLQLSKSVGMSESRLCKLLRMETGENFSSLLHQHRITAAKHLLREEALPLKSIAGAVGYKSSSFFFKIFKRISGMTPREYSVSLGEPIAKE